MGELLKDKIGEYYFFKSPATVDFEVMKKGVSSLKDNDALPRDLRMIEDARGVNAHLPYDKIEELQRIICEVAENFNFIKHAVIHDRPENTAMALLFEHNPIHPRYKVKVFSTEKAAKEWIAISTK